MHNKKETNLNLNEIWKKCAIPMPIDAKRNMMNASSNFEIIKKIILAIKNKENKIFHSPGANGNIGGYPLIIEGEKAKITFFEKYFSKEEMEIANKKSIYLDKSSFCKYIESIR